MKGSSGWVILGLFAVLVLFILVRVFWNSAFGYKLKEQKIVFEETELLRVKNALLLAEKSLEATWKLSSVQAVFQATAAGFGSEYWYRTGRERTQQAEPPTNGQIKAYMEDLLKAQYKPANQKPDGITLTIDITPEVTLADSRITVKILQLLGAFAGDPRSPATKSSRNSEHSSEITIGLKKLVDAGKAFASVPPKIRLSSYSPSTNANNYIERSRNAITDEFNSVSFDGNKKLSFEAVRLVASGDLSRLLLHYIARADFEEKEARYNYLNANRFEKKPFSLTVKAEDYTTVLDCGQGSGLFTHTASNDMLCSGGLYTCNTIVDYIGDHLKSCGGRVGSFGCGPQGQGFAGSEAVLRDRCYCSAFGGTWFDALPWVCPAPPCETVTENGKEVQKCQPPRSGVCPVECNLNGNTRACAPPPGCA